MLIGLILTLDTINRCLNDYFIDDNDDEDRRSNSFGCSLDSNESLQYLSNCTLFNSMAMVLKIQESFFHCY